ncbi:ead/Ea22-like family protein [Enterobacter hormaechei]|uniref:ead/Ea22-like family protein n=1 Tax=Enterobacter hormaechei TaxID=158836 RepID=UPI000B04D2B5
MSNIDKQAQEEKTRETFERWAEESGALPWGILKKHRNQNGSYPGPHYTYMWHAWNACNEALLDELEVATDACNGWQRKFAEADERLQAAQKRIADLESDNAYIKNRHKELDLLIGKNILVMQAAIIEWQGTGDARKGLAWIYNTLFGPGELPDEAEKDAQAYFDRKYAPLDEELMNLHRWFWEQSEAERAAAAGKGD